MSNSIHAAKLFDEYATLYEEKYMDVSLYHNALDAFGDGIVEEKASILELACGPGNVTQYLLEKNPDWNVLATDLSQNMLQLAEKNAPKAKYKLMDCREIYSLSSQYHGIVASFCLPYLDQVETQQFFTNIANRLKTGGRIYLSTMEGEFQQSTIQESKVEGVEPLTTYYYTESNLTEWLSKNQLEVDFIERKHYKDHKGNEITDLLMVAAKQ